MKIGICGDISRWKIAKENNFDYVEANFSKLASINEEEFEKWKNESLQCGLSVEAYNGFFSSKFCIYGDLNEDGGTTYDFEKKLCEIKEYAEKAFSRAKLLGGKVAVLGSSRARNIPEGLPYEVAEAQFINVLRVCGDAAAKYGMRVALEPLRLAETNFINTVSEGYALCKKVDHPAVGLLVDFFHFYSNGETIDSVYEASDLIIHAHIARPDPDRKYPTIVDKEACRVWAKALRDIGYKDRISLECSFGSEYETALPLTAPVMDMFRDEKYIG